MKNYVDSAGLQEYTNKLIPKLKTIFPGAPLKAATAAAMTDTSKVYVYTGNETGYVYGDWYTWNGTAWEDGGVYNALAVETDPTLLVPGMPADAKATGEGITDLKNALDLIDLSKQTWARGRLSTVGVYVANEYNIYTSNFIPVTGGNVLSVVYSYPTISGATGTEFHVHEYSSAATSGFVKRTVIQTNSPKSITLDSSTKYVRFYIAINPSNTIVIPLDGYKNYCVLKSNSVIRMGCETANKKINDDYHPNAVCSLDDGYPAITKSGTTYTVTIKGRPRLHWSNGRYLSTTNHNETKEIVISGLLVYNPDTDEFLTSTTGLTTWVTLLLNINGYLYGQWAKYYEHAALENTINERFDLFTPSERLTLTSGIITTLGNYNSTSNEYIRSVDGTLPKIRAGDYVKVYGDYEILYVIIFSQNKLGQTYFYANPSLDNNRYYAIPDEYIGKYFAVTVQKTSMIGQDISAYVNDAIQNIKYFVPSKEQETEDLPQYYNEHIATKSEKIRKNSLSIGRHGGQTFFVTDYHIEQNARHSGPLVKALMQNTGLRMLTFGGDAIQSQSTKQAGYNKLVEFTKDFSDVLSIGRVYNISGNHEENNPSANPEYTDRMIPKGTVYQLLTSDSFFTVHPLWSGEPNDYYHDVDSYYMDDNRAKIRYYFIGCDYNATITIKEKRAIANSFSEVPEGYAVIIFSHMGIRWDSTNQVSVIYSDVEQILSCAKAMNDGQSVTIQYTESFSETYNYTGKARDFLGVISGHCHYDDYVMYDGRFPVIATAADAYQASQPAHHTVSRDAGTITEQAFDSVQFDIDSRLLCMVRIGAGNDRTFHCTPTSEASYTTTLTDPVWASSDTSVATVSNGTVTAVSAGYAVISATSETDGAIEYWVYQAVL